MYTSEYLGGGRGALVSARGWWRPRVRSLAAVRRATQGPSQQKSAAKAESRGSPAHPYPSRRGHGAALCFGKPSYALAKPQVGIPWGWCAVCGVWCAVCGVRCVVCGVWCVVCGVRCAVCGVRWVVCGGWWVVHGEREWCAVWGKRPRTFPQYHAVSHLVHLRSLTTF